MVPLLTLKSAPHQRVHLGEALLHARHHAQVEQVEDARRVDRPEVEEKCKYTPFIHYTYSRDTFDSLCIEKYFMILLHIKDAARIILTLTQSKLSFKHQKAITKEWMLLICHKTWTSQQHDGDKCVHSTLKFFFASTKIRTLI